MPEPGTITANILAGESELLLGRGLDLEQAADTAQRWPAGKMDYGLGTWIAIFPQFIDPNPAVIGRAEFRRALMHAIDRNQMVDTFMNGLTPVAHTFLDPKAPEYPHFEKRIARYEYDPRRAAALIEGLGYTRGPDGTFLSSAGQELAVEARTTAENTLHRPTLLSLADYWQRAGVKTEVVFIPAQRQRDLEYRNTRPGFELLRANNSPTNLATYHSRGTPLPENNYTGLNYSRYMNPDFDALIDTYFRTIPLDRRTEAVADIMVHISDQLNAMGLYYNGEFSLISNRLVNVRARQNGTSNQSWNAHEWDVK